MTEAKQEMGVSTLLSMTTLFLEILLLLPLLSNAVDLSPPFPTNFLFGTASSSYQVYTYLQSIYSTTIHSYVKKKYCLLITISYLI